MFEFLPSCSSDMTIKGDIHPFFSCFNLIWVTGEPKPIPIVYLQGTYSTVDHCIFRVLSDDPPWHITRVQWLVFFVCYHDNQWLGESFATWWPAPNCVSKAQNVEKRAWVRFHMWLHGELQAAFTVVNVQLEYLTWIYWNWMADYTLDWLLVNYRQHYISYAFTVTHNYSATAWHIIVA